MTGTASASAQPFLLPTANTALYEKGGEEKFFVGTVGKPWVSGTYGCVRTEGWQFHEGLDIRSLTRNSRGEPMDPVMATADGTVAYINTRAPLSNYGIYIVLRHFIDGFDMYSLYAHLSQVSAGLKHGSPVKAGETIAIMGRTSNSRQAISRDRAHVHFEVNLVLNERFPDWYRKANPGQRNDHGGWNGQNLVGLNPWRLFVAQKEQAARFNLGEFIRQQTDLCRIQIRATNFSWLLRYPALVKPNPAAAQEGIAGYEIALNYAGLPFELIPLGLSELKSKSKVHLLSVNAEEYKARPCRRLVTNRGGRWQLARNGEQLVSLLVY